MWNNEITHKLKTERKQCTPHKHSHENAHQQSMQRMYKDHKSVFDFKKYINFNYVLYFRIFRTTCVTQKKIRSENVFANITPTAKNTNCDHILFVQC